MKTAVSKSRAPHKLFSLNGPEMRAKILRHPAKTLIMAPSEVARRSRKIREIDFSPSKQNKLGSFLGPPTTQGLVVFY